MPRFLVAARNNMVLRITRRGHGGGGLEIGASGGTDQCLLLLMRWSA